MARFTDLDIATAEKKLAAASAEPIIHNDTDLIAVKIGKLRIRADKKGNLIVSEES